MYTIKQKNKTLSVYHEHKHFVIGFKTALLARKVHYNIHPDPKMTLVRSIEPIDLSPKVDFDISLILDVASTLFIPKCKGSIWEPMNDGMFHVDKMQEIEFYNLPISSNLGIIVPYKLEDETNEEFMFKAYVVEPKI